MPCPSPTGLVLSRQEMMHWLLRWAALPWEQHRDVQAPCGRSSESPCALAAGARERPRACDRS
eukprot:7885043-Lingulodinium_polyedra.AAC.1